VKGGRRKRQKMTKLHFQLKVEMTQLSMVSGLCIIKMCSVIISVNKIKDSMNVQKEERMEDSLDGR